MFNLLNKPTVWAAEPGCEAEMSTFEDMAETFGQEHSPYVDGDDE